MKQPGRSSVQIPALLRNVTDRYQRIITIIAPPRSSSTAFARVFWEHPAVGYYAHEPFETTYFDGESLTAVAANLRHPINLRPVKRDPDAAGNVLVIKEMPYQVGDRFPLLAHLSQKPLIFLLRDPRINISSRMRKKKEVGHTPLFPHIESGWHLLRQQVAYCRQQQIDHCLIDANDFRSRPLMIFPRLFRRLGLPFTADMLKWQEAPDLPIDNLDGRHRHLYEKVLNSRRLLPDDEKPPALTQFPTTNGWRAHVRECLTVYQQLRQRPERIH